MPHTILSILAHPDDAEFLCAGTLIRLKKEHGCDIHIASMTAGDCGSVEYGPQEIARLRYNERTLEKVTRLLRLVQPTIVLTHSPADYMLDHETTSTLVRAAAFAGPIPNFLAERRIGPVLPHIPHLYYCDPIEGKDALGRDVPPSFHIDISGVIDAKANMLAAHASQRDWLLKHHGMDHYLQAMRDWSAKRGSEHGVAFAEGFRQHLGHSYPQDNVLGQLLSQ
jgi:N-acetylglucosamine malate deacetylase 1